MAPSSTMSSTVRQNAYSASNPSRCRRGNSPNE
jgi:hypothetical protein